MILLSDAEELIHLLSLIYSIFLASKDLAVDNFRAARAFGLPMLTVKPDLDVREVIIASCHRPR